jgi:predicted Rossmann-fold nucleotide-binding protein
MEAALKGASRFCVDRIGVTTHYFQVKPPNAYVEKHIIKDTYLDRLFELVDIADGYVVLPGGTGTLLELAMVWALRSVRLSAASQLYAVANSGSK